MPFPASCQGSPIEGGETDYQEDEYDYGDLDDGADDTSKGDATAALELDLPPPYFEVNDIKIEAKPGDDVVLNCDARNFQREFPAPNFKKYLLRSLLHLPVSNAVMWYKNKTIIANGQNAIGHRVEAMANNSIILRDATAEDSDDYYCEILPQMVRQHTTLRVGARLSILCDDRDVTDRSQTFRQGDHHKLECRTYLPGENTIKWSFNVCCLRLHLPPYHEIQPHHLPHNSISLAGSASGIITGGHQEWRCYPRQHR